MSPPPEPAPEALQQRYAAIEQVYVEQNWREVEVQCQGLLSELADEPGDPLRQRLLLLLAHTLLYGTGDPAAAASLYAAVLEAGPEPVLAAMAEQGLSRCGQPYPGGDRANDASTAGQPAQPGAAEDRGGAAGGDARAREPADVAALAAAAAAALEPDRPAAGVAPHPEATPAMPWLEQLGPGGAAGSAGLERPLTLAPFQQPLEPTPGPVPAAAEGAGEASQPADGTQPPLEEEFKPLRWPFRPDYVERRLPGPVLAGSDSGPDPEDGGTAPPLEETSAGSAAAGDAQAPSAEAGMPTPAAPVEATAPAAPADIALPEANQAIAVLEGEPFSVEELIAYSRGLLRISTLRDQSSPRGQSERPSA